MNTKKLVRIIIISGWILCMLTCVSIVFSSLYLQVFHPYSALPSPMDEWSSMVLGFILGTLATTIKEFVANQMDDDKENT